MRACKPLPYGQLTTALVPTVPSPCFLRQSSTVAKVRETFLCLVCPYPFRDRRVVVGGRQCHGLVLVWFESSVLRLVYLDRGVRHSRNLVRFYGNLA